MGAARASGWNRIPLVRMTNVRLEPGTWTLDDLIADTDDGIYMETNRSWSIDDRRLNFQFGTEVACEIKGGKLGGLLKNATYTGITPQFWGGCDAVCNRDALGRLGHAQLRQGPAGADDAHRPRRGPGPLPRRARRGGPMIGAAALKAAAGRRAAARPPGRRRRRRGGGGADRRGTPP